MIRIVKANIINKNIREDISFLFVDSFYDYFKSFNLEKDKLYKTFEHCFDLNKFYVVLLNEEVIGIGACSDGSSSISFKKNDFCTHLGNKMGERLYEYLKIIFEERDYAFEIDEKCGMIEFVAIKENYRNKKIGYILTNHIICDNEYHRYLAKVGDNNLSARKILDNIGFEVFDEESATGKEKEDIGVNNYFYMICENPSLKR